MKHIRLLVVQIGLFHHGLIEKKEPFTEDSGTVPDTEEKPNKWMKPQKNSYVKRWVGVFQVCVRVCPQIVTMNLRDSEHLNVKLPETEFLTLLKYL